MTATIISATAIAVSIASFLLTYKSTQRAERRGRMPVLVVFPDADGRSWHIENIGKGAALNIVVAQGAARDGGPVELRRRAIVRARGWPRGERWCNPVHLRPMPTGGRQHVPWHFEESGIGIACTDVLGNAYTTRTSRLGSIVIDGRGMPEWSVDEWRQVNELEQWAATAADPRSRTHTSNPPWGAPWSMRGAFPSEDAQA